MHMGEDHGRWEETGITTEEPLGIRESVCIESEYWNWRGPSCHQKVKKAHIRQSRNCEIDRRESEGVIVPKMLRTTEPMLGKYPYFIQDFEGGKSE